MTDDSSNRVREALIAALQYTGKWDDGTVRFFTPEELADRGIAALDAIPNSAAEPVGTKELLRGFKLPTESLVESPDAVMTPTPVSTFATGSTQTAWPIGWDPPVIQLPSDQLVEAFGRLHDAAVNLKEAWS